ncbi:hypothetical protein RRG08_011594 [Elysia crispata]|uniref:Uncharacterized protein n=1 Tax=Elysia crispata TaxID=231223 RepID=A0AAE0XP70_9GAST|nr:hypothetical protein RRG08_011594 [Elysia crispata]
MFLVVERSKPAPGARNSSISVTWPDRTIQQGSAQKVRICDQISALISERAATAEGISSRSRQETTRGLEDQALGCDLPTGHTDCSCPSAQIDTKMI